MYRTKFLTLLIMYNCQQEGELPFNWSQVKTQRTALAKKGLLLRRNVDL